MGKLLDFMDFLYFKKVLIVLLRVKINYIRFTINLNWKDWILFTTRIINFGPNLINLWLTIFTRW